MDKNAKKALGKIKRKPESQLKKEAWKLFSEMVRREEADMYGIGSCVTCGVRKPWKQLQAGHFTPGRHNAILFDRRGIHSQCSMCNVFKHGAPREYDAWMRSHYEESVIKELDYRAKLARQWHPGELEGIIELCKLKLKYLNEKEN